MSFIEMKNIRKDFGKQTILHNVNMSMEKGKSFPLSVPPAPVRVPCCAA